MISRLSQTWLPVVMTSMPSSKSSSARGGVIPKPAAEFSPLAMMRWMAWSLTSEGSFSLTMMRPGLPKMSPIKSMRKITPQEISFEDNTQGGRLWLHEWAAYRMKKLLTAKVAKESRKGREESLGITLNTVGSPG